MIYLLDANTLIEAKNRYYRMSFCPGYWSWVEAGGAEGVLASVASVGAELSRGNDELAKWADAHGALFLAEADKETQSAFGRVAALVAGQSARMKAGAVNEFLGGADPWLIAKAIATNAVVVTHEQRNLQIVRKFTIPNVCAELGVQCMDTFELLDARGARFVLAA